MHNKKPHSPVVQMLGTWWKKQHDNKREERGQIWFRNRSSMFEDLQTYYFFEKYLVTIYLEPEELKMW